MEHKSIHSRLWREVAQPHACVNDIVKKIDLVLTLVAIISIVVSCGITVNFIDKYFNKAHMEQHEWSQHADLTLSHINKSIETRTDRVRCEVMRQLKDLTNALLLRSPYPIEFRGTLLDGQTDFANICKIVHWNIQWTSPNNTMLKPSSKIICVKDLPRPQTQREWQKFAHVFEMESGTKIVIPDHDFQNVFDDCACTVGEGHLMINQMCVTPICVTPHTILKEKQYRCNYCNGICCDCFNCGQFRAFFGVRTALLNTGKVKNWDQIDVEILKKIHQRKRDASYNRTIEKTMETLYARFRIDHPQLPEHLSQVELTDTLYQKLHQLAIRILGGPINQHLCLTRQAQMECDQIHEEAIMMYNEATQRNLTNLGHEEHINEWLKQIEKKCSIEEEQSKGGSDVMATSSHNMNESENVSINDLGSQKIGVPEDELKITRV